MAPSARDVVDAAGDVARDGMAQVDRMLEAESDDPLHHLEDFAAAIGYDHPNIHIVPDLPPGVSGLTTAGYRFNEDDELVGISNNDIYLPEALFGDGAGESALYEEGAVPFDGRYRDAMWVDPDAAYHEIVHGKQNRHLREQLARGETYTDEELDALMLLHEGQASLNADRSSYRDAMQLVDELLQRTDAGEAPGEALAALDDQYVMACIALEDGGYDFVVAPQEQVDGMDEAVDMAASAYGTPVDRAASYAIDFSSLDTAKIADHVVDVQQDIEDGYRTMVGAGYDLATLPSGAQAYTAEAPAEPA